MAELLNVVDEFTKALSSRDVDRAVRLYAADAVVVAYGGVATGPDEIRTFLVGFLSGFEQFDLISVDQVQESHDTVLWDATSETGVGALQTTNVFILNDQGLIVRHVPLMRGFWGKT